MKNKKIEKLMFPLFSIVTVQLTEYISAASPLKSMQLSTGLTGRAQVGNRGTSGVFAANETVEPATYDPLIGRKVWTRWPEDNHFYEAVITDFNPIEVSMLLTMVLVQLTFFF